MSDAHLGIVRLPIEGRTLALQFTLGRIAPYGRDGITQRLRLVTEGGAGDGQALAELLEIATGGDVIANDLMEQVVGIEAALIPLHAAWTLARLGPVARKPGQSAGNPLSRLWTSLLTLWRRVRGRG
jgi:hypothetical protein